MSRTRTSGGTAGSPARCSCTRRPTSISPTSRRPPDLADDLTTGTLELTVELGFARPGAHPGWTVEATLRGQGVAVRAEPPGPAGPAHPTDPANRSLMRRVAASGSASLTPVRRARLGGSCSVTSRPPRRARSTGRSRFPTSRSWTAETPARHDLVVTLRAPDGSLAETATVRVGFRRVEIRGLGPARERGSASSSAASIATTSTSTPDAW